MNTLFKHIHLRAGFLMLIMAMGMAPMLLSCQKPVVTPAKPPVNRVQLMTATGELATVEYTVSKIIKAKDCTWWKIGEKRVLFKCNAYLTAGVDMTQYDDSKTQINEAAHAIVVTLPKVKLMSCRIPFNEIRLVENEATGFRHEFSAHERQLLLRQGEQSIRADVDSGKYAILADAERNTRIFFERMLNRLGYKSVTIKFEK